MRLNALCRPYLSALLLLAGTCAPVFSDQILEVESSTLTTYVATTNTTVQGIRPIAANRGVFLDGSMRLPSLQGWALAGNPFGESWNANARLGDVRLDIGAYAPTEVDLALPASVQWIVGRSFNAQQDNGSHLDSNGYQGRNWMQMSQPELVFKAGATANLDVIYVVYGADRSIELRRTGDEDSSENEFKAKNGAAGVMQYVAGDGGDPDTYVYYDQVGRKTTFFGGNTASNRANWQIWKIEDPAGNMAYVGHPSSASTAVSSGYNADGTMALAYDSAERRYTYSYTTLDSVARLTQVKAETKTGGTWASPTGVAEVGRVEYAYYESGGTTYGDIGNLKTVTQTMPTTDSSQVKTKLYRYWVGTFNASTNPGHPNTLQYVVENDGYRAADWAGDSTFNDGPLTMTEANLKPYASAYFEYDSSYRISKAYFDGDCGCSGGNNGTYTFSYATNGSFSGTSGYDTAWKDLTILARPDAAYVSHFYDEIGQPLHKVETAFNPSATDSGNQWAWQVVRNSAGILTTIRTPANAVPYTASTKSFGLPSPTGTVQTRVLVPSGDMVGLPIAHKIQNGNGSAHLLSSNELTSASLAVGGSTVVRPLVQYSWTYTQETTSTATHGGGSNPAGAYETQRAYTMWTGAAALMPKQIITTHPAVDSGKNGSNSATSDARYLRKDGTVAFTKSADGIFSYSQYTNGQLVKQIQDAQTNHGSAFASGDDPNTDFGITETGAGLHRVTSYTYDAQGRSDTVTHPDGRVSKMYYTVLADRRLVTISIPKYVSGSPDTFHGPASYTVTNHAGKVEMQGTIALSTTTTALSSWIDEGDSDPIVALDVGTLASMKTSIYNETGTKLTQSRGYFSIPSSGAGTEGTHYDATRYGYDPMGRTRRVKTAAGTVMRTVYDEIGRKSASYVGTNDNGAPFVDPDGDTSGTYDMVKIEVLEYDGGNDQGNSYLTKRTLDADGNWAGTGDQRVTEYKHDYRGRGIATINPQSPHVVSAFDNLGRMTATATYSSSSGLSGTSVPTTTTNRLGYSETFYDEKGQVYRTTRHKVTSGSSADSISNDRWYDKVGRVIKVKGDGQHAKYRYNRVGWQTHSFSLAMDDDTGYGDADDVSGDIVLQENQSIHDTATGLVLYSVALSRHHDDLANGRAGELDSNADADAATLTAANCYGRPQITAMYYDLLNRLTDTAMYGTNGIVGDGSTATGTFTRAGSVPSRSDTILVTTNTYNTDGTLQSVTDPKAIVTRYEYDALFRQTKVIKNYVDGTPGGGTHSDEDQTIKYEYAKGLRTKIIADLPGGATDQETVYMYGTTAGTPGQMAISTGHLLRAVRYPDSTNTGTSGGDTDSDDSDLVSYAYNALSEQVYTKDQAGNVIETDLDTAGRQTQRRVTTLISGFDGAVRRIAMTYTSRGQVEKVTQYDNAAVGSGSVTDDIKYTYDDWGHITGFKQDVDSEIGVSASGRDAFEVTYTYAKASPTDGATRLRKTGMTSPGLSSISYEYLSASNKLDDAASRVSEIDVGIVTVASYAYNGVAQVVGTDLPEPNFYSRQYGASMGSYPALDTFGRVIESTWTKGNATPRNFYDVDISYDRASNITLIQDNIHTSAAAGTGNGLFDVAYTNDGLGRLIQAKEGNWNGSSIDNTKRDARWMDGSGNSSLDQVGNWGRYRLDLNGDGVFTGTGELDDTRTHNVVNELTGRDTDSNASDDYTLAYNDVGNMTDDGKDYTYIYDAFGRLRQVKTRGGSPALVSEYRYNGLNFRISWHYDANTSGTTDSSDPTYFFCHDERWRIVATFRYAGGGTASEAAKEAFLFHNAGLAGMGSSSYIDAVVLRQRDENSGWTSAADGTLEERLYPMQNWRADVSLVVSAGAILKEFVKYSAYGEPFALGAGCTSSNGNVTTADLTQLLTWIGASAWDARADTDTDGDLDFDDDDNFNFGLYGRGYLSTSAVANRIGYAGYQHARELAGAKWHVRNRFLDSTLGRWTRRDPLGYVDGMGLYEYVVSSPILHVDALGAAAQACAADNCAGPAGGWPGYEGPTYIPPHIPTGPQLDPCCEQRLGKCMEDEWVKRALRLMQQQCSQGASITCDNSNCEGAAAYYCCWERRINICPQGTCESLAHELIHAADSCNGYTCWRLLPWQTCGSVYCCAEAACTEVRAHALSGRCCQGGVLDLVCVQVLAELSSGCSASTVQEALRDCLPSNPCDPNNPAPPYPQGMRVASSASCGAKTND